MESHLKEVYGFNSFRSNQKDIIVEILNNKNVSAILPTGGGKSLLYQFPATFSNKITIIISPLISLMNDQCTAMQAKGIQCASLNGLTEPCSVLGSCKCKICKVVSGEYKLSLIYTTPEWISTKGHTLSRIIHKVCLIAIDEAHCISQWSHDFRPSYKKVAVITSLFPNIPVIAVTATATPKVLDDIYDTLDVDEITEYSLGTRRENLAVNVFDDKNKWSSDIISGEGTIIYTQTRKECEKLSEDLIGRSISCLPYHAGLSTEARERAHSYFLEGKINVIVATISFGMGIDKSDIRHVINYGVPTDIETYYQEIGRAGRDGLPAKASIYYSQGDFGIASFLIQKGAESQISRRTEALNKFRQYLGEAEICRQQMIDNYFATGKLPKESDNNSKCGICDNCCGTTPGVLKNIELDMKRFANAIMHQTHGLGITRILELGKSIGRKDYLRILLSALIKHGVIESYSSKWGPSHKQQGTLYKATGKTSIPRDLTVRVPERFARSRSSEDRKLSQIRTIIANRHSILEQTFMNDKVLSNVKVANPQTVEDLWLVDGISVEFIKMYGQEWIDMMHSSSNKEKSKFYALKSPSTQLVFTSWEDCKQAIAENPGSKQHKSFKSREEADKWLSLSLPTSTIDKTMQLVGEGKLIEEISEIRKLKPMTIENHISEAWGRDPHNMNAAYLHLTKPILLNILTAIKKTEKKDKLRPIMDNTTISVTWVQLKLVVIASNIFSDEELIDIVENTSEEVTT